MHTPPPHPRLEPFLCEAHEKLLCAKDVAGILGISERSAARLMLRQDIHSCLIGPGEKLRRTVRAKVEAYKRRQWQRAKRVRLAA